MPSSKGQAVAENAKIKTYGACASVTFYYFFDERTVLNRKLNV